jgi:hypothetical protein
MKQGELYLYHYEEHASWINNLNDSYRFSLVGFTTMGIYFKVTLLNPASSTSLL